MAECPTCNGSGAVPQPVADALRHGITEAGQTCHCDGPPHTYSPGWCPRTGPVTGRKPMTDLVPADQIDDITPHEYRDRRCAVCGVSDLNARWEFTVTWDPEVAPLPYPILRLFRSRSTVDHEQGRAVHQTDRGHGTYYVTAVNKWLSKYAPGRAVEIAASATELGCDGVTPPADPEVCSGCGGKGPLSREFCDECHVRLSENGTPPGRGGA